MYPLNTLPTHPNFLGKKYNTIESISLEGYGFTKPETVEDVLSLLEELPPGFIKDYEYGLGLLKDYRFVIDSIEELQEIKQLVISINHETKQRGDIYTLNDGDFDSIRRGINRITKTHQAESRVEKTIFSYNSLLNKLNPIKFPEKLKPYKKDVIYKLVLWQGGLAYILLCQTRIKMLLLN